jgi:putative ABC transport system ATP-binding protein
MLEVKDVYKTYVTGDIRYQALSGVNLSVEKGEFTSIMGKSGSGKSTFMNILGCLDKMDSGNYILNGQNVTNLSDNELAYIRNREIGFVFQSFNLLPRMSILENVELPMIYGGIDSKVRRKKAMDALEKVGLANWIKHKPNEISGGQKQRVAIARAIVNNPDVIMADEPTGNLDSIVTAEILRIFQQLNEEGSTIIMVTHESEVAQYTKKIVRFSDGKIVSDSMVLNRKIIAKE